jgi:hypothetical protein
MALDCKNLPDLSRPTLFRTLSGRIAMKKLTHIALVTTFT